MKRIWKYILNPAQPELTMPVGAEIISAGDQHGSLTLWAEVDPDAPRVHRIFQVYGTGFALPEQAHRRHIATVQMGNGLVWHVYETTRP